MQQLALWEDDGASDTGAPLRYIGRCERGHASRAHAPAWACHCGARVKGAPLEATHTHARRCDARCEYAQSPVCSCSCGGRNHGRGLALVGG